MTNQSIEIEEPPTLQIQLDISIIIRPLTMFFLKTWRSTVFGVYGYLNFTKSGFIEHSKKFKPEDMLTRINEKNCIVTGANSGLGFATAEGLASRGATVYMVCRNKERGEAALSKIQSTTGNQNVHLEVCDLSSVSEIKSFASRFSSKDVPIHILVNNAGVLEHKRVTTSEGFELNFSVNVLGTYSITELMLPLVEKAAPDARVITVSSGGMYTAPLTTDLHTPTEANITDCIRYGDPKHRNTDVRKALDSAIDQNMVVVQNVGAVQFYVGKNERLWKCVNPIGGNPNQYPKALDSIQKFLTTSAGRSAMMATQSRYEAALTLRKACLEGLSLGEIFQILNMVVARKWINPHHSGWQPISISLAETKTDIGIETGA